MPTDKRHKYIDPNTRHALVGELGPIAKRSGKSQNRYRKRQQYSENGINFRRKTRCPQEKRSGKIAGIFFLLENRISGKSLLVFLSGCFFLRKAGFLMKKSACFFPDHFS